MFRMEWERGVVFYEPISGGILSVSSTVPISVQIEAANWFARSVAPLAPAPERSETLRAERATLIPTTRCNLRCSYCYANGGEADLAMPEWLANWAVDHVAQSAEKSGAERIELYFHGGGEPTQAWGLIQSVMERARLRAAEIGASVGFGIATNGLFSQKIRDEIMEKFQLVSLALDGPEQIHNAHRKTSTGAGSFDRVMKTLQAFDEAGFENYAIVSTVAGDTLDRLPDTIRFFAGAAKTREIHLGPVVSAGRAGPAGIDHNERAQARFREALDTAWELGLAVSFPGVSPQAMTEAYCGAVTGNVYVTHDGLVSRCLEACSRAHPMAGVFGVGDVTGEGLMWHGALLNALGKRVVENLPHCASCALKWHCAGDCPARVTYPQRIDNSPTDPARCELKKNIFAHFLGLLATKGPPVEGWPCQIRRFALRMAQGGQWRMEPTVETAPLMVAYLARKGGGAYSQFSDAVATCPGG